MPLVFEYHKYDCEATVVVTVRVPDSYVGIGGGFAVMVAGGVSTTSIVVGGGGAPSPPRCSPHPGPRSPCHCRTNTSCVVCCGRAVIIPRLCMALVFPVGLFLIVVMGAELFTGNCMFMTVGLLERWQVFVPHLCRTDIEPR